MEAETASIYNGKTFLPSMETSPRYAPDGERPNSIGVGEYPVGYRSSTSNEMLLREKDRQRILRDAPETDGVLHCRAALEMFGKMYDPGYTVFFFTTDYTKYEINFTFNMTARPYTGSMQVTVSDTVEITVERIRQMLVMDNVPVEPRISTGVRSPGMPRPVSTEGTLY